MIITEIMYDPAVGADADNEWVELYNTTATSIELNGADLRDLQNTTGAINASTVIQPGERVVIATGTGANWGYDFTPTFFYGALPAITNQSDDKLFIEVGTTVIDATPKFNDPTGGNGVAYVLSGDVLDSVGNNDALNWCAADALDVIPNSNDLGTPFDANPVCP